MPCKLCFKARLADRQRGDLLFKLGDQALELGAVQPRKYVACLDHIALFDLQLGDKIAFGVLDDLGAGRRNHRAPPAHDLVNTRHRSLDHENRQRRCTQQDDTAWAHHDLGDLSL